MLKTRRRAKDWQTAGLRLVEKFATPEEVEGAQKRIAELRSWPRKYVPPKRMAA